MNCIRRPPAQPPLSGLAGPGSLLLLVAAVCATLGIHVAAQERLAFIGVAYDANTRDADRRLLEYLTQKGGASFAPEQLEYERVIDRIVNWNRRDGFFVARMTPYAYVAAEMLGAEVEPLAAYVSASTRRTTYHSYFVVARRDFPAQPALTDLVRFMRERRPRARFVYHSQFSTSSYFLPLLFFRSYNIFNMPESTESLTSISSERRQDANSSKLVELVARGDADIAAVWDDTKSRYEAHNDPIGRGVYFIQLPTTIPNDLLVTSAALDGARKAQLSAAIRSMRDDEIAVGDFQTWRTFAESADARKALGDLRWLARERQAPVTVEIAVKGDGQSQQSAVLLEAARQAVRLAGTEFVRFDEDFHAHIDFRWTLERVHDGAARLVSTIPGSDVDPQTFRISFDGTEDLTRRIVSIVQSRMHRIRYVWPFSSGTPIVIRDTALALPANARVRVQKVTWIDPDRNRFVGGPVFSARINGSSYYRYELNPEDFVRLAGGQLSADPMSNSTWRVILLRPDEERLLFRVLTAAMVLLFAFAAIAALWESARSRRRQSAATLSPERV
jgi:ABC-type phosphate/phosphonate transport system substrate-binding protein